MHLKPQTFARHRENRFSPVAPVSHVWWFVALLRLSYLAKPSFSSSEIYRIYQLKICKKLPKNTDKPRNCFSN